LAVSIEVPAGRSVLTSWATPLTRATLWVTVPPPGTVNTKSTEPVGVPVAGDTAATVARKVTAWPKVDGLRLVVRLVMLLLPRTTCWALPMPLVKFASPV
jgi:hypothetical protein